MWDRVRKISGKNICPPKQYLNGKNGTTITDPKDIANEHAAVFTDNSSSAHYSATFQAIKEQEEKVKIDFISDITRLRIGQTKATKSHILSRGPPTGCHHCGQTLTIDHILLECALLQECRDEYYTVDSLNALFETIPETCIVEFLREAGFFYLIWCNLLISTSPQYWTIWSDLSNCLENESNSETHSLV